MFLCGLFYVLLILILNVFIMTSDKLQMTLQSIYSKCTVYLGLRKYESCACCAIRIG